MSAFVPEHSIRHLRVLPEREDLHCVRLIVESVHAATVAELDLCAAADLVVVELCSRHVVGVHRVDLDAILVPYH